MSGAKDPAIKLFGKTIPVPPEIRAGFADSAGAPPSSSCDVVDESGDQNHASSTDSSRESHTNRGAQEQETDKDTLGEKPIKEEDVAPMQLPEELANPDTGSRTGEEAINVSTERESSTLKTSKIEEGQGETSNSRDKNLKKPDKILPCPRCNSMDTKFCYYNNYNVNQPRHFCKNCQRYWTAGGTMRNVPIGAGRRKNKTSPSPHNLPVTVSEATALLNAQMDSSNRAAHHPSLKSNGSVLTFGSGTPLCESMASGLNLADKLVHNYTRNGFHKPEELRIHVPHAGGEKGDDQSNKSSVTSAKSMDGASTNGSSREQDMNYKSFPPQAPYYPGNPWPYQWNPVQWNSPPPPPGLAVPFYPTTPFWGGMWNIPGLAQPSSQNGAASNSGTNSLTLGKHSREENVLKLNESGSGGGPNKDKCLWVPKTLRIDDSGEAAKSSLWTSLGIKNDKAESVPGGGGLFKAFTSKHDEKNHSAQASSPLLQANPAAFSRSLNFRETS